MKKTNSKTVKSLKYSTNYTSLDEIFKYEKDKLIDFFSKEGVVLHQHQKIVNYHSDDKVKITFLPRRFDIIFKSGYVVFDLKE